MDRQEERQSYETFVQTKVEMIGRLLTDVASGNSDVIREVLTHGGAEISEVDVQKARYVLPWKSYWDLRELNASSADLVSQELVDTAWKICCSFYGTEASEAAVQVVLGGLGDGLSLDEAAERALPAPPIEEG